MPDSQQYQERLEAYTTGNDPVAMQSSALKIVEELIAGVPEQVLRQRPAPDKWSIVEILAHLADDELATSWRYRQMIEGSGCALAAFDQVEWARIGDYRTWDASDALHLFRLLREANLRMLKRLTGEEWERFGVHAERGKISVRDLVRHMAGHDVNHLDQIRAILRKG